MKKLILLLVLTVVAVGGIFAQEKYDGSKKNTFFFGPVMVGYERTLFKGFSIGAEAGIDLLGIDTGMGGLALMPFFADAFARWYPWQRIFFVNLGLGYEGGGIRISLGNTGEKSDGFHIKPQVGWKIDIGEAGGWVFEARAGIGMTFGRGGSLVTFATPLLFGRTF
jgi:hypothetical protein